MPLSVLSDCNLRFTDHTFSSDSNEPFKVSTTENRLKTEEYFVFYARDWPPGVAVSR